MVERGLWKVKVTVFLIGKKEIQNLIRCKGIYEKIERRYGT